MKKRVITAIIALILFIPFVLAGGAWLDWLTVVFAIVGISEIFLMKKEILVSLDFLLALLATVVWTVPDYFIRNLPWHWTKFGLYFGLIMLMLTWTVLSKNETTFDDVGIYTIASLYIGTGFHYMAAIRSDSFGLQLLFYVFVVVWSTDIGAYVIGRKLGRHKLWPVISPHKTWEGSVGAVICALIFTTIYLSFVKVGRPELPMIGLAFCLSIVGQMGDLVESAYKRFYGVKDSGKLLPGHGGILDRFDSMLFVLPVVAAILGIVH